MPVNYDVKGKVVALTGGASGIGYATAKLLSAQGALVSLADVNEAALKEAAAAFEQVAGAGRVLWTVVDVRDEKQVDAWVQRTVDAFGPLDAAINLAGVIPKVINIESVEEHNTPDWQFVLDVNLTGVFFCMRAELQHMKHQGSIVNAASIAGTAGFRKNAAYCAAKHGVIGLSRAAAKEVGEREIRINCIAPGIIDSPMQQASRATRGGGEMVWQSQIKRRGTCDEVASLCAFLVCDETKFVSGAVYHVDGGWVC
ncbi:NAD(P)-binding domain protein [Niveomyces insectorum RCEF 264]|uniref:NAD(P)-binding domain protein n=1 Tax=Niveomyces insectorum RCEF 264 TaxID=1081102 RepID=A0A167Q8Y4_9HYPO|nr:NAD(P)-binding domain protein [Niveomyces insectorum RCEF 264]